MAEPSNLTHRLRWIWTWVLPLMLAVGGNAPGTANQARPADPAFITRVAANQQDAMKRLAEYCFRQHIIQEKLNADDKPTQREERQELVCHRDGVPLYKQLVVNGRPTGQRETDAWPTIQKDGDWQKKVRRAAERNQRFLQMIGEVPKAFDLTPVGEEVVEGRPTVVYRLTPKPGYHPRSRTTEVLKHITGRGWVDRESAQMVRFQAQVGSDFNMWGGLLLKVRKGGTFEMRQKLVDGVWLPYFSEERWHARIGLVKHQGYHQRIQRSDFRPASRVLTGQSQAGAAPVATSAR